MTLKNAHDLARLARTHNACRVHSRDGAASPPFEPLRCGAGLFARSRDRGSNDDTFDMGDNAMINPHKHAGKDLEHVAEKMESWPKDTDFVYVNAGTIHMVKGGCFTAENYIDREQWAAAKSLHQYWFPEEQPKPEGYCDVCGDTHCIHEPYPGICAEYDGGSVSLDLAKAIYNGDFDPSGPDSYCDVCGHTHLIGVPYPGVCEAYAAGNVSLDMAKAIYNGDFRPENAEDSMNKTSDLVHRSIICPEHGLQDGLTFCPDCLADQASAREDELSRRSQIDLCTQLGGFTSPEEDEAWREAEKKINPVWQSPHDAGGVCVYHGIRYAAHERCHMCVLANAPGKEKVNLCPSCGGLSVSTHGKDCEKDDWIDEVLTPEIEKIRDCINRLMKVEKGR